MNPVGKRVRVRAEIRIPEGREGRGFLRFVVGRTDPRSPIGLSRQGFFEDLPHYIEALMDLYEQGIPAYIDRETHRIRQNLERDMDDLEEVVGQDMAPWKVKLHEIRKSLIEQLPENNGSK